MFTRSPGLMSLRFFPFMLLLLQPFGGDEDAVDDWAHYRERPIACHNIPVWPTPHPSHHDAVSCSKRINTTGIGDRRATAARSPPGGLYGRNRERGLSR